MLKLLTVIGARPQIIKASALSRCIKNKYSDKINDVILHTGQHYDYNMSEVFINELNVPLPQYNLNCVSEKQGVQTAQMVSGIEEVLEKEKPDYLVLFGDTNSTLAGAVAASKTHIPIVHIEAGLRSFDKTMPEEINRIVCDHVSTLLFAPTQTPIENLKNEGFNLNNKPPFSINNPGIFHCGDIMYDNTRFFLEIAKTKIQILEKLNINNENFCLCTIHRVHNTDNKNRLKNILTALYQLSEELAMPFILPLHPRTKKKTEEFFPADVYNEWYSSNYFKIVEPISFLEITLLESLASVVITDSGGVQKEAYFMKKPSVVLRKETEWVEIIKNKAGALVDDNPDKIKKAVIDFIKNPCANFPEIFGDGNAAGFMCEKMLENNN